MGKRVKIRTLVALAGPGISLAAGDEWEVEEDVAEARIVAGLAEPIDPPAQRRTVQRAGQTVETASVEPEETREEPSDIVDAMLNLLPDAPRGVVDALIQAGYDSPDALAAASDAELQEVDGVGPATLKKIRAAVEDWYS